MNVTEETILIVEDEKTIAENISDYLKNNGYKTIIASDGEKALEIFDANDVDMIILDLMLPKISGEDVCIKIRKNSNIPIIMLTAKVVIDSKINGIEIGADIYLTKPFSLRELAITVKSLFRRVNNFSQSNYTEFNNGDLKINFHEQKVIKKGEQCKLTKSEKNILFSLAKYPKKIFTRDELIKIALGEEFDGYDRAIDSHIKNLRSKIEDNTGKPKYVLTVRGVGYRFGE
ncbi:MAG: response regulator transcription factor [Lachnospirales bacterium]